MAANCTRDVVFVMDGSSSVGPENFEQMKSFVSELVGKLDIDSGNTRVGVVTYSNVVEEDIELGEYSTTASLQSAIASHSYIGRGTLTHVALEHVRTKILTMAGDRSEVPNIVVVLTNGESNRPHETKVRALCCIVRVLYLLFIAEDIATKFHRLFDK